ncbi:alpha-2-macroglobulin family protein [Vibrio sp. SCSIO 43137]|uniref:alpha-2-macroglobulin family protein n=1 Tax=Vibrio sp. SCSIO 43137 TaxID=3021011 RepID=UPI0023079AFF|nr:MG2 domain-containing protein [Vibrio sp. SCSIO 43137]WCE30353.1 MG2 domain-containing protein [Vibrio sp. SCSIO 43137]
MINNIIRYLARFSPLLLLPLLSFSAYALQESSITVIGNGPLVPKSAQQSIPVSFTNMEQVDIEILQVTDAKRLLKHHYLLDSLDTWNLRQLKHAYKSVFSDRYQLPKADQDVITSARLPIPQDLPSGWYLVVVKAPGDFSHFEIKHMLLSDIGIQARVNKQQAAFAVTRLSTGEAIEGAEIELLQEEQSEQVQLTDEKGLAYFNRQIKRTDLVIVAKGDEFGLLSMREVPLDLSEYKIGGRKFRDYEAYIYSNRDLVKPGESLPINVLLRNQDGEVLPLEEVDQLYLTVTDPRASTMVRETLSAQAAGYYSYSLRTSGDWKAGRYTVEVRLDPSSPEPVSQYQFQLEEFVPERMDLTLSGLSPFTIAGEKNQVELAGRYLFGAPAAGNVLKAELSYQPVHYFEGEYKGFFVGKKFRLNRYYEALEGQTMSEQGTLTLQLPTPESSDIKSPVKVAANFALQESGGAAIQRNATFISWKDKLIPGIKPASKSFAYQSSAQFDIALLAADGQSLKEGEVEVILEYNQGPYYWVYEEGSGWSREEQPEWKQIAKQALTLAEAPKSVSYSVDWGDYRLKVTDLASGVESVYPFYAGWFQGYDQQKAKPEHLTIHANQPSYSKEDKQTQVSIVSPMQGSLLVTLETEQVVWSKRIQVDKGDVTVDVPLLNNNGEPLNRHDVYLTATLTGQAAGVPKRYFGVVPLKLNREKRKLNITMTLPERIEPMKTLSIPVEVANLDDDQVGNTWVTVSIVDKGITNMTRYTPKDPYQYLFGQRRYSADIVDLFSRLYDTRPNPFAQPRFGGDLNQRLANNKDDLVESKTVILMSSPVELLGNMAVVEFDIPDYNGEGQIVATVFNDRQVGQLVQDSAISAPVVAELSVPRFVVAGDKTTTTADLFNNSGQKKAFSVQVLQDGQAKALINEQVVLDDGERWSRNVPFSIAKQSKVEQVEVGIKVSEQPLAYHPDGWVGSVLTAMKEKVLPVGENKDQEFKPEINIDRQWRIPVRSSMPWIIQAKAVKLAANQSYVVEPSLWEQMNTVTGKEGELHISATPILSVTEQAKGLIRYPYGCAEQTTSKAWPFLLESPELQAMQAKARESQKQQGKTVTGNRDVIADSVQRLRNMQRANGGFGLWDRYSNEQYWLTAYITEFLAQADKHYPGVVPKEMLDDAYRRLREYLNYDSSDRYALAKAYAAYLLSEKGWISYSDLDIEIDKEMRTGLSNLQLIASFNNVGATDLAKRKLKEMKMSRNRDVYHRDYGSELRDLAAGILILDKIAENAELEAEARALQIDYIEEASRRSAEDNWISTQERAALLRAAVLTNQENNRSLNLLINGKEETIKDRASLPLIANTMIANKEQSPIYVKALATGYLKSEQSLTKQHPFNTINVVRDSNVKRVWYQDNKRLSIFSADKPSRKAVKVGDRIAVYLIVELDETIHNAMVIDRIPAGFVLENPNLGQGLPLASIGNPDIKISESDFIEYRQDRFVVSGDLQKGYRYKFGYTMRAEVPGEFVVPPLFVEAMYKPELHFIGGHAVDADNQQSSVVITSEQQ